MARRAAGRATTSECACACDYERVSYCFLQKSIPGEKKNTIQVWSRAPVSNKRSHVWCVINEQEWDPEGEKGQGRPSLLFIIFIAQSSFLNYPHCTRSPLASTARDTCTHKWAGRPHAGPDGLHLCQLLLSLWEVKHTKTRWLCHIVILRWKAPLKLKFSNWYYSNCTIYFDWHDPCSSDCRLLKHQLWKHCQYWDTHVNKSENNLSATSGFWHYIK